MTKCTKTKFGAITQHHNITILANNNTRVLELLMFYDTRNKLKKVFKVLSFVIYTIIGNYVFIDYLACE